VDEAPPVDRREAAQRLPGDPDHLRRLHEARPPDPVLERLPLEELHRDVVPLGLLARLVDGDQVVVLDRGERAGLPEEALAFLLGFDELGAHHLERDGPPQDEVLRVEDHAHPAAPEHLEDPVVAEAADLVGSRRRTEEGRERIGLFRGGARRRLVPRDRPIVGPAHAITRFRPAPLAS
jgi:hypothetical protein